LKFTVDILRFSATIFWETENSACSPPPKGDTGMDGLHNHQDWVALASTRHEEALRDAAIYRRIPRKAPNGLSHRLRDHLGDWLISSGLRIKTGTLVPGTRPA